MHIKRQHKEAIPSSYSRTKHVFRKGNVSNVSLNCPFKMLQTKLSNPCIIPTLHWFYCSWYFLVKIQQCKHQNNVWICTKFTTKTIKRAHQCRSGIFINFEQIHTLFLCFHSWLWASKDPLEKWLVSWIFLLECLHPHNSDFVGVLTRSNAKVIHYYAQHDNTVLDDSYHINFNTST